jgi:hypothetical protein
MQRKYVDEHYFDLLDTEAKAYFLGFIFADGCNTGKGFNIQLRHGDIDVLQKLKQALRSEHKISTIVRTDGRKHVSFGVQSAVLSQRLTDLGCVRRKSLVLEFPTELDSVLYRHFIRGFVDGNGYFADVSKRKAKYAVYRFGLVSTLSFCRATMAILESACSVYCGLERMRNNDLIYMASVRGRLQVVRVLEYLYGNASVALDRKWSIARKLITTQFIDHRYIKKIPA